MTEQKIYPKEGHKYPKEGHKRNFLTNSPKGNEKANRKFSFAFLRHKAKREVFQQIYLQEKDKLKRGRVKEEQKIGNFLTNSPKRGRVKGNLKW